MRKQIEIYREYSDVFARKVYRVYIDKNYVNTFSSCEEATEWSDWWVKQDAEPKIKYFSKAFQVYEELSPSLGKCFRIYDGDKYMATAYNIHEAIEKGTESLSKPELVWQSQTNKNNEQRPETAL